MSGDDSESEPKACAAVFEKVRWVSSHSIIMQSELEIKGLSSTHLVFRFKDCSRQVGYMSHSQIISTGLQFPVLDDVPGV